jgi:predicted RNA binding protein YcfA (HicA-like mRNA interferase family)
LKIQEVIKVLTSNGWKVARRDSTHHVLTHPEHRQQVLAIHDKEIGSIQVKKIAKRFKVRQEAFFKPTLIRVKTPGVKIGSPPVPKTEAVISPSISIGKGPLTEGTRLVFLPASILVVDHRYQRPLNAAWARQLVNQWDDRLLGILTVSEREDGFALLEGQHRVAALVARGEGTRPVPCLAFKNLSLKEEADIYLGRNTVKLSTTLALFHAKLVAGDSAALEIHRIVTGIYGLNIGGGGGRKTTINCLGALQKLEQWGVLGQTFFIWNEAWQGKADASDRLRAAILLALGTMVNYYGKLLDHKRLAAQLRPYSAPELLHMALAKNTGQASSRRQSFVLMVDVFRGLYNYRMKEKALPVADLSTSLMQKWVLR